MMKNMKRVALVGSVLALSAVTVFAGAALAQGPGPANQAATGNAQANRNGRGGGSTGPGYGLAVKGAWGGPEQSLVVVAAEALDMEQADLVVLDLMLPDRDGWDVTRIVRGDPSLAATPIIMVTARVEDTDRIVGLELGADDYVTKPFNPREIVARVRAVLRLSLIHI